MIKLFAIVAMVLLTGCDPIYPEPTSYLDLFRPRATALSLKANRWTYLNPIALFNTPDGDLAFDFPDISTGTSVNYVFTRKAPAVISGSLVIEASVEADPNIVFDYRTDPDNTCDAPAAMHPFIWANGNDPFGEFSRWWAVDVSFVLAPGSSILSIPLQPESWLSVFGKHGDASLAATTGFHQAIKNVSSLGLTFGGGCWLGHGIRVSDGNARFSLSSYKVVP
jgi:hypothetical protein